MGPFGAVCLWLSSASSFRPPRKVAYCYGPADRNGHLGLVVLAKGAGKSFVILPDKFSSPPLGRLI